MRRHRGVGTCLRSVGVASTLLLVLATSLDGPVVAGATADRVQAAAEPYDVVVAETNDLLSLDPLLNQDGPGRIVYGQIYEPLLRRSADGLSLSPLLAAALPTVVDETTWEVTLNTEVTFANGEPLTAADVVYTIERVIDPDLGSEQTQLYQSMTGAEAVDDATVRITTAAPDPILPSKLAILLIMPEGGAEVEGFPDTPESLNGTGPYAFVSRTPGVETVVEKRDDYWGDSEGAPQRMTMQVVSENSTRVAGLETGDYDIAARISADDVGLVPSAVDVVGTESVLLRLNALEGAVLADPLLRQAINVAIDREGIVEELLGGYAEPSTCQIAAPNTFGHNSALEVPAFDPDRARELIAESGVASPEISFTATERFAKDREVAQAIAQNLQDVGFTVELNFPTDVDQLRAELTDKASFPSMFMFGASSELFDVSQQTQWITSDGVFSGTNNPEIDELTAQGASTTDPDERTAIYDQLADVMCEDAGNVYLYYPRDIYGLSEAIEWTPRPDQQILLLDVRAV